MGEDGYSYGDEEEQQPGAMGGMGGMGGMGDPYNDEDESPQYEGEEDGDYGEEESLQQSNANPYPKQS